MPGKVNPVIPEAVTQAALATMANDTAITSAAAMGNLELNAFGPLVADKLLESISLLTAACELFTTRCVTGIEADDLVGRHPAVRTADPQVFGRLLAGQPQEEIAIGGDHALHPGAILRLQIVKHESTPSNRRRNLYESGRAAYPDQAQQVLWMMFTAPLTGNSDLVVDATGVGKPVVESVRARRAGGTLRAGLLAEVQAVCRVNA